MYRQSENECKMRRSLIIKRLAKLDYNIILNLDSTPRGIHLQIRDKNGRSKVLEEK